MVPRARSRVGPGVPRAPHIARPARPVSAPLRTLIDIKLPTSSGSEFVIPVPVKFITHQHHCGQLRLAHLHPGRILPSVELRLHAKPRRRSRVADAVDNGFVGRQRSPTPVRRDVAEKSVLDLVPFARAGGEVAHLDRQANLIGQPLKLVLPRVTPKTAGRDRSRSSASRRGSSSGGPTLLKIGALRGSSVSNGPSPTGKPESPAGPPEGGTPGGGDDDAPPGKPTGAGNVPATQSRHNRVSSSQDAVAPVRGAWREPGGRPPGATARTGRHQSRE